MAPRLEHDRYTIAWIAILPIEAEAALRILDRRHDGFFESVPGDDYLYIGGELNKHNVVIATLPAGQNYGVGAAAALANQIKARFSNIWFALLVGVAAGLPDLAPREPSKYRDIRLGDVLVCLPDKTGTGVIHYDLGRDTDDGFHVNGYQAPVPAIVRSAISYMQLLHERPFRSGNVLATYLCLLQDSDRAGKFARPNPVTDQLFGATASDDQAREVHRESRDAEEPTKVWYGNIGSGSSLMRNAQRRDALRDRYDLIGLEMEAAGIMNVLPTGVVRGVCDYGDRHKTKHWQSYAAAVAAVYAKGLLNMIQPKENPQNQKVQESRKDAHRDERHHSVQEPISLQEDEEFLASLAFPQMSYRRLSVRKPHQGTCHWILNLPEYRSWDFQSRGFLWIRGKPGAGKSTIMSFLYSVLGAKIDPAKTTYLEFFFTARGDILQYTFFGMLRSLLNQIYRQDSRVRAALRHVYLDKQLAFGRSVSRAWEWQVEELKSLLEQAILVSAAHRQLFLFVDALDEAGEDVACDIADYLHNISVLAAAEGKKVKMCISCRHYPVAPTFQGTEISVEDHNEADIRSFIEARLYNQSTIANATHRLQWQQLATDMVRQANGIFQWVTLVLPIIQKSIRNGLSPEQAQRLVKKVPKGLSDVYEHVVRNVIDRDSMHRSFLLFQWVCFAETPLNLQAMHYALAMHDTSPSLNRPMGVTSPGTQDFIETSSDMGAQVRSLSGGLLEVTKTTLIQTVHQTVKEFLINDGLVLLESIMAEQGNVSLMTEWINTSGDPIRIEHKCHALLYWRCLKALAEERDDAIREIKHTCFFTFLNPFLEYAVTHVFIHARQAKHCHYQGLGEQAALIDHISRDRPLFYRRLSRISSKMCSGFIDPLFEHDGMKLLQIAVVFGLVDLVNHLLDTGISNDIDEQEGRVGFTALHFAVCHYHEEVFSRLISAGANINSVTFNGTTPLHLIGRSATLSPLQRLLKLGALVNYRTDQGRTALMLASGVNNVQKVRLLLEHHADVDVLNNQGETALMLATSFGQIRVARLLLKQGAHVNIQDNRGRTALTSASKDGHEEVVRLLLEHHADVDIHDSQGETALMLASNNGHEEVVRLLLEHHADVDAHGNQGETALMLASSFGHIRVARLLLKHGAHVDTQDDNGRTALISASKWGHKELVRLLLEHHATISTRDNQSNTAFTLASERCHKEVVQLLHEPHVNM